MVVVSGGFVASDGAVSSGKPSLVCRFILRESSTDEPAAPATRPLRDGPTTDDGTHAGRAIVLEV